MSTDQPNQSHATAWVVSIIGALVLYVGSAGPVSGLIKNGTIPESQSVLVIKFYAPIQWLYDNTPTPLRDPLNAYEVWWINALDKP